VECNGGNVRFTVDSLQLLYRTLTHATAQTFVNLAFCHDCKLLTLNAFTCRPELQLCRTMVLSRPLRCLTFLLAMLFQPVSPRKSSLGYHAKDHFSKGRAPPPSHAKPHAPAPPPPSKALSPPPSNCSDAVNDQKLTASWNTTEPKLLKRRRLTKQDIADVEEGSALTQLYNLLS